jgi:hypothetical protein
MDFRKRPKSEVSSTAQRSHPFRAASPSSEPPRSASQVRKQEAVLLEILKGIRDHDLGRITTALSECGDVNFIDYEIKPLVFAAYLGQLDTVLLLVSRGADKLMTGKLPFLVGENSICYNEHGNELTPAEAAKVGGHGDVIRFLEKIK